MGVNLSIKDAPETVVKRLKARAVRHHRSLQGELMAILEAVANEEALLNLAAAVSEIQRLGLRTRAESTAMIREHRNGHSGDSQACQGFSKYMKADERG